MSVQVSPSKGKGILWLRIESNGKEGIPLRWWHRGENRSWVLWGEEDLRWWPRRENRGLVLWGKEEPLQNLWVIDPEPSDKFCWVFNGEHVVLQGKKWKKKGFYKDVRPKRSEFPETLEREWLLGLSDVICRVLKSNQCDLGVMSPCH